MKANSLILAILLLTSLSMTAVSAAIETREKSTEKVSKSPVSNVGSALIVLKPFVENEMIQEEGVTYFSDYTQSHDNNFAPWAFTEEAMEILDHYAPFIFRTKKSAEMEELKVVLSINEFGKLTGFRILNDGADKGLKERMGHVLRKLPAAVPVPGFQSYEAMDFQLVMAF